MEKLDMVHHSDTGARTQSAVSSKPSESSTEHTKNDTGDDV